MRGDGEEVGNGGPMTFVSFVICHIRRETDRPDGAAEREGTPRGELGASEEV